MTVPTLPVLARGRAPDHPPLPWAVFGKSHEMAWCDTCSERLVYVRETLWRPGYWRHRPVKHG